MKKVLVAVVVLVVSLFSSGCLPETPIVDPENWTAD
jgi:hypothetical protein